MITSGDVKCILRDGPLFFYRGITFFAKKIVRKL